MIPIDVIKSAQTHRESRERRQVIDRWLEREKERVILEELGVGKSYNNS